MNHKQRKRKHLKKIKQEKNIESERNITNFEKIKKNIEETFPDIKTNYSYNPISKYYEVTFTDLNTPSIIKLSILEDSKWIDIKKNIEKRVSFYKENHGLPECLICYEKITTTVGYCNVCSLIFCRDCFLKILINNNNRVFICPQCRYTIDRRHEYGFIL